MRLEEIRRALASHTAQEIAAAGQRRAAVAMILAEHVSGPRVLFIERARRSGDPWSGHMAFPGGRVEQGDAHPREAAERETLEEVGLPLQDADCIGRLDDKQGNPRTHPALVISGFVYALPEPVLLAPNHEVQEAFWFPLRALADPVRHVPYRAHSIEFPGIQVGEPERHVVWGLTYSFLESFFRAIGRPLPNRWKPELAGNSRGMAEPGL